MNSTRQAGEFDRLPVIDVGPLAGAGDDARRIASDIHRACRDCGFFYIVNHGVDEALQARLHVLSRRFFDLPLDRRMAIRMELGGPAWRGYFPVGGELTSGRADLKEGIYFGEELPEDHPAVRAGTPLHGRNLFPEEIPDLRPAVLDYMAAMTRLGHTLMRGIALSLDLNEDYFAERYTAEPLTLFRIFNYPAGETADDDSAWGVGEHTDYGLLTILRQDDVGGLQVKSRSRWIDAPPQAGSFVCNLGDMLDRMTGGLYRSTPHRVLPPPRDRLSFPFFFDPNFNAEVRPIASPIIDDRAERWDRESVHEFQGTYGDYLLNKVSRVFPQLRKEVLK